ncbi:MAG: MTH1187 family thiamine-binding protein [Acidimicrobiia bacterium]|nr:MTH1187 family thiamine-binding protein [Acidimicrobiia bacterium]
MVVAFSITPIGIGDSVSEHVADAVRIVRASGLPSETGPMFTTVEGEWDEVMAVIRRAMDAVLERAPRVSVSMKIDDRPGASGAMEHKVAAVEERLAQRRDDRSA